MVRSLYGKVKEAIKQKKLRAGGPSTEAPLLTPAEAEVAGKVAELHKTLAGEIRELQKKKLPKEDLTPLLEMKSQADSLASERDFKGAHAKLSAALDRAQELWKTWGVAEAEKLYASQMKGEVSSKSNPKNKFQPKNLDALKQKDVFDPVKVAHLMEKYSLTEGEVLAIRTFTSDTFRIINPATANQKDKPVEFDQETKAFASDISLEKVLVEKKAAGEDCRELEADIAIFKEKGWLDDQNRLAYSNAHGDGRDRAEYDEAVKKYMKKDWMDISKNPDSAEKKKELYEEGSLHAGMIMNALKKLPAQQATLYRGERMDPVSFKKQCVKGYEIPIEAFQSQTTSEKVARNFANGDLKTPKEKTIGVVRRAEVLDARNIAELSVYASEEELLVMPGGKFVVEDVISEPIEPNGMPGGPTERYLVVMKHVPAQ